MLAFFVSLLTGGIFWLCNSKHFSLPMWSQCVCDVLAVAVVINWDKIGTIYLFVCLSNSFFSGAMLYLPLVNGFAKKRNPQLTFWIRFPSILFWQTGCILHYAFSVMQTLTWLSISCFLKNMTLFWACCCIALNCVYLIDFYYIYFSDNINK